MKNETLVTRHRSGRLLVAAVACWLPFALCITGQVPARGDNIDGELLRQAPKVMEYLREQGYENIGVLNFRVSRNGKKPTLFGSLLNNNMADRLKNALILAIDPERPVQVIDKVRETSDKVDYTTPAQRMKLFRGKFQVPFDIGEQYVSADAFVTGKVSVSGDYATTTIAIEAFNKRRPEVFTKVAQFDVASDRYVMADLGQGFSLSRRGVQFMRGATDESDIIEGIHEDVSNRLQGVAPAGDADGEPFPVKLTVRYNDQPQTLEPSVLGPDNWNLAEPQEGENITFDVENVTDEKLGLVVMVNGVSTLYMETGQPDQLRRWVLRPRQKCRIKGFHEDMTTYRRIMGLSDEETRKYFEELGGTEDIAGLIHVCVFREQEDTSGGLPSVSRGSLRSASPRQIGSRPPRTWKEMQQQIASTMKMKPGRGLMGPSSDTGEETLKTEELPEVQLTDTMVIRYWSQAN
jgi:hypothetical protein